MNIDRTLTHNLQLGPIIKSKTPSHNLCQKVNPLLRSNSFEQKRMVNTSINDFSPNFKPPTPDNSNLELASNLEENMLDISESNEFTPLSIIEFDANLKKGLNNKFIEEPKAKKPDLGNKMGKYFELNTPCSKSSLELVLYSNQIEEIYSNVLKKLGPHKNGCDILKGLKRMFLEGGFKNGNNFQNYFLSKKSDFYDYYYIRELQFIVMECFMK